MNSPQSQQSQTQTPAAPQAAQTDLLGEAASLKPPPPPTLSSEAGNSASGKTAAASPKPAEDENQPGFIGERNLPHP